MTDTVDLGASSSSGSFIDGPKVYPIGTLGRGHDHDLRFVDALQGDGRYFIISDSLVELKNASNALLWSVSPANAGSGGGQFLLGFHYLSDDKTVLFVAGVNISNNVVIAGINIATGAVTQLPTYNSVPGIWNNNTKRFLSVCARVDANTLICCGSNMLNSAYYLRYVNLTTGAMSGFVTTGGTQHRFLSNDLKVSIAGLGFSRSSATGGPASGMMMGFGIKNPTTHAYNSSSIRVPDTFGWPAMMAYGPNDVPYAQFTLLHKDVVCCGSFQSSGRTVGTSKYFDRVDFDRWLKDVVKYMTGEDI